MIIFMRDSNPIYSVFAVLATCILMSGYEPRIAFRPSTSVVQQRSSLPPHVPNLLGTKETKQFVITDLGTLGGRRIWPHAINNAGQIVGETETQAQTFHAFLWQKGHLTDLGVYPNDFTPAPHGAVASLIGATSGAMSINNSGQIVGQSEPNGEMQGGSFQYRAMLWENGQINDLGTLLYPSSAAKKINDQGEIIGDVIDENNLPLTRTYHTRPFLFQNGHLRLLDLAPESVGLNNTGEIVGSSLTSPHSLIMIDVNGKHKRLAGFATNQHIFRTLINDRDQIVVVATNYQDESSDGYNFFPASSVLWQHGKSVKLKGLKSYPIAEAKGLNNEGSVVGEVRHLYAGKDVIPSLAVLWRRGIPEDLNTEIPQPTGWLLQHAEGINDAEQIVGWGELNGAEHAFLLTPARSRSSLAARPQHAGLSGKPRRFRLDQFDQADRCEEKQSEWNG